MTESNDHMVNWLFKVSRVFCILPWVHIYGSVDGVWGRCCLDKASNHDHYYRMTSKPVFMLESDSLGCSYKSTYAISNPDKVCNLLSAFNSPEMKLSRLQLLNETPISACENCYSREADGIKSYRQKMNMQFERRLSFAQILSVMNSDGSVDHPPSYLDIRFGNACNLKCVMCGYPASSKWNNQFDVRWHTNKIDPYETDEELWRVLRKITSELRYVHFAGGEPFLQKGHFRFLNLLIETGASPHIDLSYNTNLLYLPDDVLKIFAKFRRVEIGASCDGIEKTFESIRRKGKWNVFVKNLEKVRRNTTVRLLATVQKGNIENLEEFVRWAIANNYQIDLTNILYYPDSLNISSLPLLEKRRYTKRYHDLASSLEKEGYEQIASEICMFLDFMNKIQ